MSTDEETRTSRRHSGLRAVFRRKLLYAAVASCFAAENAYANPAGPAVVNGQVSFNRQGSVLNVTNSPGAVINWQSFSIGASETTRFIQQSAASSVLNRVVGRDPSILLGTLQSNGRVFLINPTGILVGQGARIDVGSFVASTLNITDENFRAGRLNFGGPAAPAVPAAVQNLGAITTPEGGSVYLIASSVENRGVITTPRGEVMLAAGNSVRLVDTGTPNVYVEITAPDNQALNLGRIIAQSGRIGISAGLVNQKGVVSADSAVLGENGKIVLKATRDATLGERSVTTANGPGGGSVTIQSERGTTLVSGRVEATGSAAQGGAVKLLGNQVGLIDEAQVNASGRTGGGTVLVGGDYQGGNPDVQNASRTFVGSRATLRADAVSSGDGGKVIVWADDTTRFYGSISARGGAQSGNGGFVETSGKEGLTVFGARVDTGAPAGSKGTWLLDPPRIVVQTGGSAPLSAVDRFASNPGTTQTVDPASINGATSNVILQASDDVTFTDNVTIAAAGVGLTAQAGRSILVNANISTNNGDVGLKANETVANGVISADRSAGAATLAMAPGTTINAGTGNIFLRMNDGTGHAGTSGNVVVENLTADNVSIIHRGMTADSSILRASANSLISANTVFMELENAAGANASIGTSAAPIRVRTPVLEAHTHNAGGGIFIDSPISGNMQIGGVPASIFSGTVRGVQNVSGGPVQISVNGDLSQLAGTAGCGTTGGTGGPICAGTTGNINVTTSNSDITLNSDVLGSANITIQSSGNLTQNAGTISNVGGLTTVGANDVRLSGNTVTLGSVASQRDLFITASGALNIGNVTALGAQNFHFDDNFFTYTLPFTFNFYGTPYTRAFISSNGVFSFDRGVSQFTDSVSSLASYRIIAPAWNDWETRSPSRDVYISSSAGALTVRWDVERWPTTGRLAQFEAMLGTSGNITFNYGPANNSFTGDVTIGLANLSTASRLVSQLMSQTPFSLNRLNSTAFSYNTGSGTYTETVSPTSNWSGSGGVGGAAGGALSALRNAALSAGTSIALNGSLTAPTATLTAQNGSIAQSAPIVASSLSTQSATGTMLTGTGNTVGSFTATNSASGNVTLTNTGALNVTGVSQTGGGDVVLASTGALTISGPVTNTGNIVLISGANIQTGSGAIVGNSLTTDSVTGTALEGSSNAVANFNATNTASGNISFSNTAPDLNVTGISQSGGGAVTVGNTNGTLTISGPVVADSGTVTLQTSGSSGSHIVIGAQLVAGGAVVINATPPASNVSIQDSTVNAGGAVSVSGTDLNVTSGEGPALLQGASMNVALTGAMNVHASSFGSAQVQANNGQSITARSIDIRSAAGGEAVVRNNAARDNSSNQTVTINGTGSGEAIHVESLGGPFAALSNFSSGLQSIAVNNADAVNVLGTNGSPTIGASIDSLGGQTILVRGAASRNQINVGSAEATGLSFIRGNNQAITAGTSGQSGSITVIGGAADGADASIVNSSGTQSVSAAGAIAVTGGSQPNTVDASGAVGYILNSGTGLQTINAGTVEVQGGSNGSNNAAFIASDFSSQNVTVGGHLALTGGSGAGAEALMFGDPDVILTVGGKVMFTTGVGTDAFARILAGSVESVRLTFSNPSVGGFVFDGVPSTSPVSGGSGFFAGGSRTAAASAAPVTPGENFHVSFAAPASSTQAADQAVQAVNNSSIQATTSASTTSTQSTGTPPADTSGTAPTATGTTEESVSDREKKDEKTQEQKQAAASDPSASKAAKPKPQLCN